MQRPSLKIVIPKRNPELEFRKSSIVSMLKYMYKNEDSTETTLQTIFNGLKEKTSIQCIKCHALFVNERAIIYVKSITINNCEIPINLGFYKSTGISRGDTTIKNCWFPTTHLSQIVKDFCHFAKPEDNYILKYDSIYTLSTNVDEIKEQDDLLHYGRFINENNALVSYFLYSKNKVLSELVFEFFSIKSSNKIIHYTDFLEESELLTIRNED